MKYYLIAIIFIALVNTLIPCAVFASDVSDAQLVIHTRVTNNGTTAAAVSANLSLSTQSIINANYLDSYARYLAVQDLNGTDIIFMPSVNSSYPWCFFVPNILAGGSLFYDIYTSNASMGVSPVYFPGPTGMTITDDPTMEPSGNFTIVYSGYVDTNTTGNITRKDNAVWLGFTGTGEITGQVYGTSANVVSTSILSSDCEIILDGSENLSLLTSPPDLPAGISQDVAFSINSTYLAVAHLTPPYVTIYKRSGDTLTKLSNPASLPANACYGVDFSPDATYLSLGHFATPFVTIYKRTNDTFTKLSNPANLPTGQGNGVDFSSDDTYLAVAHDTSPFVTIYKRSGDTFTKLANPADLPTGIGRSISFSSDGTYLAVAHTSSPYVTIYKRSGDTFTKLANPANLPTNTAYGVDFSSDDTYLAVAHDTSPFVTIYKRSGDTFTKLADPASLPNGIGYCVEFSEDVSHLLIGNGVSHYNTIYRRSVDTFNKINTPASGNLVYGIDISDDGHYIAMAELITPFVEVYTTGLRMLIDGELVALNMEVLPNVPDSANDWIVGSAVTPYINYWSLSVNGTNQCYIDFEYNDTTFTDDSGNGNDATPTFRTSSSDADVSMTLLTINPVSYAVSTNWTSYSTSYSYGSMATTLSTPTGLYTELDVSHIPGDEIISDIFATSSTPISLFWFTLPFIVMIILGFVTYKIAPSLLTQWFVMLLVVIGFSTMGSVPLWTGFLFGINGIAIVVASKAYGW